MDHRRITSVALATLLALGSAGGVAFASDQEQDHRDATALVGTNVTLQQAITTAEQQAGGKAVSADLSQKDGAKHIVVEVAGPQGVKTVVVDAQSGQVMPAAADAEDND